MHPCPSIDGWVRVPRTELVDDDLNLFDDRLKQHVGRKIRVGRHTHGNTAVLGLSDGALRWVLTVNARRYVLKFGLGLLDERLKEPGRFIVQPLPRRHFSM
jgi:hypothetical protein